MSENNTVQLLPFFFSLFPLPPPQKKKKEKKKYEET